MKAIVDQQNARYEVKFVLPSSSYEWVKNWILVHPLCFEQSYPARVINNIYFDSPDLKAFEDNLSGISDRTKLRFRWYGSQNAANRISGKIEVKRKRNKVGWKYASAIDLSSSLEQMQWDDFHKDIYSSLADEILMFYEIFQTPVLMNSYHREYFVSKRKNLRLTVDRDLQFFDQRISSGPRSTFCLCAEEILVLELKVGLNIAEQELHPIISGIPFTATRLSKYILGVQRLLCA